MKTQTFLISNLICCGDGSAIIQKLKKHPAIADAAVSYVTESASVTFHEDKISEDGIKKIILGCGFNAVKSPKPHDGHKDHEALMADPSMAKTMEDNMRDRFLISLVEIKILCNT